MVQDLSLFGQHSVLSHDKDSTGNDRGAQASTRACVEMNKSLLLPVRWAGQHLDHRSPKSEVVKDSSDVCTPVARHSPKT